MTTITTKRGTYPCYRTMGASLLYKRRTGKEAYSLDGEAVSDMVVLLFCLAKCASASEGTAFPYGDEQDFANDLSPESFGEWCQSLADEAAKAASAPAPEGEKKSLGA